MFKTEIDTKRFTKHLTDVQRTKIPQITMFALNETMFLVRAGWREEMQRVFDRPTQLTLGAVLYRKATKVRLVAEVYIRNEASKGTPPSKYLFPEVAGGVRRQKPFEKRLSKLARGKAFYVPGRSMRLDASGNLPSSVIGQVLSQLAVRNDPTQNESKSSARSRRRQIKRGGGGRFFTPKFGDKRLKQGAVYERIETGFGSSVRTVLFPVDAAPSYRPRFNATQVARILFNHHFPKEFVHAMQRFFP